MQSKLFVLIGLPNEKSNADLAILQERLNRRFSEGNILFEFTRKEELLSARYEGVNFYVSILKSKNELPGWFEMAKNFELTVNRSEVNEEELSKRYNKSSTRLPNLYDSVHYTIGKEIFNEINSFTGVSIYSFQ